MRSLLSITLLMMAATSFVASQSYVVEVYFVVEPQVIRNYMDLGYNEATAISTVNSDVDYFVHHVNSFFQSMTSSGLSIEIRAKQVDLMDVNSAMFADCILIRDNELQADMALEVFKEWLSSTNAVDTVGYDMALVWTGYNLFSTAGNTQVSGYASVSATCSNPINVAVAEFDGTMATAVTTAHEIAHSLGAPHETYDPSSPCSSSHGFIMNPSSSPDNANRWSFSSCSASAIQEFISELDDQGNNCLTETSAPASGFTMDSVADSDILNPEKVCQRKRSSVDSYFHFRGTGDAICQSLMCCRKGSGSCTSAASSDGMVCDLNKRCDKGSCVSTSISTGQVDTDCMFGDLKSEYIQNVVGQTCGQFVGDGTLCYNGWVEDDCCETCGGFDTGIAGCKYGDHSSDCKKFQPYQICGAYSDICCETCHNYVAKRSVRHRRSPTIELHDNSKDVGPPPTPTNEDDLNKDQIIPKTSD